MQTKAIEVIRHSLNAANAALDLLTEVREAGDELNEVVQILEATPSAAPEAAERVQTIAQAAVSTVSVSLLGRIKEELLHPRFTLRTIEELEDKLGVCGDYIKELLDDDEVRYVTKHRRSDGAELIGLANRN
jgi:hypothetical protein